MSLKKLFLIIILLSLTLVPVKFTKTVAEEPKLTQVGVIGVMPEDYIGSFSLEWANTVEGDFHSEYSFPMQGMKFKNGKLYVSDTAYGRIHILDKELNNLKTIGELGYGNGKLQYPADIDVDENGNIYVADFFNNYFVKFSPEGEPLLVVGIEAFENGQFMGPSGIAVAKDGTIYVSDQLNKRIQVFDKDGNFVKLITNDELTNPEGMTVDKDGNLWVVDAKNCKVFEFDKDGNVILSFGEEGGEDNQFVYPFDVVVTDDAVYVVDRGLGSPINPSIKKFDKTGKFLLKFGEKGERGKVKNGQFLTPAGIAVDDEGNVYTFDAGYFHGPGNPFGYPAVQRLTVFNPDGTFKAKKDYDPHQDGRLINPISVSIDKSGNIWVASWANFADYGEVLVFNSEGKFLKKITGISEDKPFAAIGGVLCGKNEVYVASGIENAPIAVFDLQGKFKKVLDKCADEITSPYQMTFDRKGRIWVISRDYMVYAISKIDGKIYKEFPISAEANAIAVDDDINIYIPTFDHFVEVYDEKGDKKGRIGKGSGRAPEHFWFPTGVAVDKNGTVYVADTENGRIQAFKTDGTFLWTTPRGYYEPVHMAWGPEGYLYVVDIFHSVVRVLSPFGEKSVNYAFSLSSDAVEKGTKPGKPVSFEVSIKNKGAMDDSYTLTLSEIKEGWKVEGVPETLSIPSGGEKDFTVTVTPPTDAQIGDEMSFEITVKSKGDENLVKSLSLKVKVELFTKLLIPSVETSPDKEFELPVMVKEVANLYGAGFTLTYDKDYLDFESVEEGDFLNSDGVTTLFLKKVNEEKGEVIVGVSRTGKVDGISGDGKLMTFKFKALKLGKTKVNLKDVVLRNPELKPLKFKLDIGEINIVPPDKEPPKISVSIPSEVHTETLSISGKITDKSGVKYLRINGKDVSISSDGSFTFTLNLDKGLNTIVFEAEDTRGNKTRETFTVKYTIILKLQIGNKVMLVNDKSVEIDVPPTIVEGRTLLPIRWVAEPLGAEVGWDGKEKKVTVSLGDVFIELWIGKPIARVNGVEKPIDPNNPKVVPLILNGRTMLPVRFVAENLGADVLWDGTTKTVTIIYPKE